MLTYQGEEVKIINCWLNHDSVLKVKVVGVDVASQMESQEYFNYVSNIIEWIPAKKLVHPDGLAGVIAAIHKHGENLS